MSAHGDKKKNGLWRYIFFVSIGIVIIGVIVLLVQERNRRAALNQFMEIQSAANEDNHDPEQSLPSSEEPIDPRQTEEENILARLGIPVPEKHLDWDELHSQNADIYAWIYVSDTTVDYPIVQHPTDNSYYLNYNLDGSYGYPGCIYTEDYNSKDFSDLHTVIYGHNLKDHTMFSTLHNYEDPELMQEDHYIYIYTEDYVYVYQIFGAYEYAAIHLLDNYDLSNEYVYEQYIKDVLNVDRTPARVANIRHDIPVTKEDRIVTLSTCTTDDTASLRYLVTGVLLNPREEPSL